MPRAARLVVPHIPHHVTQRGSRRQQTFFSDDDYRLYKALLRDWCAKAGTQIWGWCLMPNHVHLILVPADPEGLRLPLSQAHRRYALFVNRREEWRGHLWQERFASIPMDEAHLLAAWRYVELNPVRAGLVAKAYDWPWSSARMHLEGTPDGLTVVGPAAERIPDWRGFLEAGLEEEALAAFRAAEINARPLGSDQFRALLSQQTGRQLEISKRGRPRSNK